METPFFQGVPAVQSWSLEYIFVFFRALGVAGFVAATVCVSAVVCTVCAKRSFIEGTIESILLGFAAKSFARHSQVRSGYLLKTATLALMSSSFLSAGILLRRSSFRFFFLNYRSFCVRYETSLTKLRM